MSAFKSTLVSNGRTSRGYVRWGLAGAVCFVLTVRGAAGVLPQALGDPAPRTAWYIKSGQWRADLRTVAAAARYLLQPEGRSGD